MKIEFKKEYLRLLYEEGKVPGKKYLFQPQLIKQYIKTVDILRNEPNAQALYQYKSLHYQKKEGNLKGIEAVYVNMQYRLELKIRIESNMDETVTICDLIELSKHYNTK